ncbi:MAG TPA: MFS transporter [Micromonosporaceae bacterium]
MTASPDRPARFREVFASGEYRAIFAGSVLSWLGDYATRAAVTAMVFEETRSAAASAAAFAITFAPWLLGGSLLVAVAERHAYRRVMVVCDVGRMGVMAVLAVLGSGAPLPVLLALLLTSALFTPAFDAARSATLPAVLGPQRYVAGVALSTATAAPTQVAGYFLGAWLTMTINPQVALAFNAVTFGVSALLVQFAVRLREPALRPERRTGLLRETGDGFRIVFTNPALRALVLLVFAGSLFAVVPEGLGAAWAAYRNDGVVHAWAQGLLMGAVPTGLVLGSLVFSRLVRPSWRRRILRPLGIATPLVLVPALLDPPVPVAAALALASGLAIGALVPVANGEFVQALPSAFRARAFGVVSAGLQLLQGGAVLVTGVIAQQASLPAVVGLWSLAGVLLMVALAASWPSRAAFDEAGARAAALDEAVRQPAADHSSADPLAPAAAEPPADQTAPAQRSARPAWRAAR